MIQKLLLILIFICTISCQHKEDWSYSAIFWGFAVAGFPITEQLSQLQHETKIDPEMIVFYLQWSNPTDQYESITSSLDNIWNIGAVPCLTWEPMTISNDIETTIPYEDILQGRYDQYISFIADEVKGWKRPLIIRFAQEMNLSRYHWGTDQDNFGPHSSEIYVKMFRYVVDFFNKQQVSNVFWAFCPNVDSIPNTTWNTPKLYYPGDQYVDILGMDGYNWGIDKELAASKNQSWTSPWRSFKDVFQPLYQELKKINMEKPIIVFETASVSRGNDQIKSLWIQEALKVSQAWKIKGIVWFQINKEEDWRINQNEDYSYIPFINQPKPSFQKWFQERHHTMPRERV